MIPSDPPQPTFSWPQTWWMWLMDLWVWLRSRQPVPDPNDFLVSEKNQGIYFSLSRAQGSAFAAATIHPLKLIDASGGGVAKVRVVLGRTAGRKADPGMNDADDPIFTVTLSADGLRFIYAEITIGYTDGVWSSSASAISQGASVPANTATKIYFEIGKATRQSNGSGGYLATNIRTEVSGSQWVSRTGNATTYVDTNGLQ